MDKPTLFVSENEARKKLLNGVNTVANIVKATIGPHGKNVLIDREWRNPDVTNDGVTIAKNIFIDDELENIAAQTFINAAERTNREVGDGTTTSIVIGQEIINSIVENKETLYDDTAALRETYNAIQRDKEIAIKKLKKQAKPIKTVEELTNVATTSVEDPELGKKIAELVYECGEYGYVMVEENVFPDINIEHYEGTLFKGKIADPYLINDKEKDRAVLETKPLKIPVIITNHTIESGEQLKPVFNKIGQAGYRTAVVISEKFTRNVLDSIVTTNATRQFYILPIKSPSLSSDQYEDLALYFKGTFINKNAALKLEDMKMEDCGFTSRIEANQDETKAIGGAGEGSKELKERIKVLGEQLKNEKVEGFRGQLQQRMAALNTSYAVIQVGAHSDAEGLYLKRKIEDAVFATKAALEEGTVQGGGLALKKVAEEMKDSILYSALIAPYNQIQKNAGNSLKIKDTVVDPVKVTYTALENAASISGILITTHTIIAQKRDRSEYEGLVYAANK